MMMNKIFLLTMITATLFVASCNKNGYYKDSGVITGKFNGTVMDYLKSKPEYFDSIVKIIKIAGLENTLQSSDVTFFAPADSSVRLLFRGLNVGLALVGKPPITAIEDIEPKLWKKYMSRYVFNFKKGLSDFPQVDFRNLTTYGGQIYPAVDGTYMNIGVVYSDVVLGSSDDKTQTTIPYAGYRYLTVSYLSSQYNVRDYKTWITADVASSNIQTNNGYVHVLRYPSHFFGFDISEFMDDARFNNYE
jgi:uncharacterized surface protein with fasciclin (FAS1) repeats